MDKSTTALLNIHYKSFMRGRCTFSSFFSRFLFFTTDALFNLPPQSAHLLIYFINWLSFVLILHVAENLSNVLSEDPLY